MSARARSVDGTGAVVVVGLGNVGGRLVPLLAGFSALGRVVLIDPDHYEAANIPHQRITVAQVGRSKVAVVAERLQRLAPALEVVTFAEPVERVAWGELRAGAICSCVDSRAARQSINRIAWRLGVPWLDTGLDAGLGLVRVRGYCPEHSDCLECGWSVQDYQRIETSQPCERLPERPATGAPAELGALAAALTAVELRKLSNRQSDVLFGRQAFYYPRQSRCLVMSYRPNPDCQHSHAIWEIRLLEAAASDLRLRDLYRLPGGLSRGSAAVSLRLAGQRFAVNRCCGRCGAGAGPVLEVAGRRPASTACCSRCGGPLVTAAFDLRDELQERSVEGRWLETPLPELGFRNRDIVTVVAADGSETHFQIGSRP